MTNFLTIFKTGLAVVGGFLISLIGGYDNLASLWIFLVVMDVVTGVIKYTYNKSISSDEMFFSLFKKIFEFIVIALAVKLEQVFGNTIPIREVTIFFYVTNEFISILENCGEFLPIPDALKDYFKQLDNKPTIEEEKKKEAQAENFDERKEEKK